MAVNTLIPASTMNFTENQQACMVLEKLWSQREAGLFCDVVLHVHGQKFHAHRNVLAACSPYFDSVFETRKVVREQLTVTCQDVDAFQLLLNYMYTGAIIVDKNNVSELLRLANHFLVAKLKNYCAEYLDRYLDNANCLSVRDMAEKYDLPDLQKNASLFIQNHIVEVFKQSEILDFPCSKLESFFKEKQFLIPQHLLLSFIFKWVEHNVSNRENDLRSLLTFVDWDSIERPYLEDHLKTSSLFGKNPKCMYLLLACLEENKIDIPEFKTSYASLKSQYGPGGSKIDSNTKITISAVIEKLQKNLAEDTSPITVVPLEKQLKKKEEPAKLSLENEEHSNSSFGDADDGMVIDYDSPTSEGDEKEETQSPNDDGNNLSARKLKRKSAPSKVTMTTRKSTANKVSKPNIKSNKPVSNRKKKSPSKYSKERYFCDAADSDDDDLEDDDDDIYTSDSSIEEPVNSNGTESKWKTGVKCPTCSYVAHSSVRLEQHISVIHAKDVTYTCKVCEFTCKWNREYYTHMKTHFQGPPFRCETCDYSGDRIQFLLSHRMRHTEERPYKCDECDHRCRTKANLECHMRIHTGEKPYQCVYCERRFTIKASLDQHLASHNDDRPHLCDICGFTTKYRSHLFSHKRIHTGDVFRCQFPNCDYSTPKKSQLGSHHRTHTAVRSHMCAVCGRAFKEKSHLVRHERSHLKDRPFKCENCDYCSSRKDKLNEHIKNHHGENATAKGPYKPRKPKRQGYDVNIDSPHPIAKKETESDNKLQTQHMELQITSVMGANNHPPAPVVYSYESARQETLHSEAAVALQQFGAVAEHNYQVALMEQLHHQPHYLQDHLYIAPTSHSAVPATMTDQNRVNVVASHDKTNVVQPTEYSTFMSFM